MRQIKMIFIGLLLIFASSCMTSNKTECLKVDCIIKNTITSINDRNTESYIESIDFDKVENIGVELCELDTCENDLLEFIKDRKGRVESFSMSYRIFIRTIEKIYKLKDWKFDLESYEYIDTENLINHKRHRYNLKLKDNLGNKWKMDVYITEYKDFYYITEPIDVNYLTKG